jgi:hypothetical protein
MSVCLLCPLRSRHLSRPPPSFLFLIVIFVFFSHFLITYFTSHNLNHQESITKITWIHSQYIHNHMNHSPWITYLQELQSSTTTWITSKNAWTWTKISQEPSLRRCDASALASTLPAGRPPRRPLRRPPRDPAPMPLGCPRAYRIMRDRGVRWERDMWEEDRDENESERKWWGRETTGGWRIMELHACMRTEH